MGTFPLDNRSPIIKQLAGRVDGVGAGKVATVDVPVGPTYLGLLLKCTIATVAATRAELETMLTLLRTIVSGTPLQTLTPRQLIGIVEFYRTGLIGDTGYLYIPFSRLWMRETGGVLGPAFGTQGETSFEVEITQDAASTIDAIEAWAVIDPVAAPLGAHLRLDRWTPSINAAGEFIFDGIKPRKGEFLYALHFDVPVAVNLTDITVEADGVRVRDRVTQALLNRLYTEPNPPRTMQTAKKIITLDFCARGFDSDSLPLTMDELLVRLNFSVSPATTVPIIAEIGSTRPTQAGVAA